MTSRRCRRGGPAPHADDLLAEKAELPFEHGLTGAGHQPDQPGQVVEADEAPGARLADVVEVPQVSPRMPPAHGARTGRVKGGIVAGHNGRPLRAGAHPW